MDVERPIDRWKTVDIDTAKFVAARENAGETQSSLSRRVGTSQSMISAIERGTKTPSVATARALARALNVSLDDIKANGSGS